jgi:N-acetylneuraminic acid mutarotase
MDECAPMPEAIAAGSCFAHNNSVYLFGGRNKAGIYSNQLWEYNTLSDQWTSLGRTPMAARVSSSACVIDDCAYIGLGFAGALYRDTNYLRDFWKYDLITQKWKRLANFPANTTSASTVGLPLESRISLANISVIGKYSYNIKKNLLILYIRVSMSQAGILVFQFGDAAKTREVQLYFSRLV